MVIDTSAFIEHLRAKDKTALSANVVEQHVKQKRPSLTKPFLFYFLSL